MILVDSNVPMYLVGASHPHKTDAQHILERLVADRERLVTDAEVLQEILHRYVSIGRREAIQRAFDALLAVVDDVFTIDRSVVERAKSLVLAYATLSARDAIHVASMQRHDCRHIISFDSGFDLIPGLTRLA